MRAGVPLNVQHNGDMQASRRADGNPRICLILHHFFAVGRVAAFTVKMIPSLTEDQLLTIELIYIPLSTSDRCHIIFVRLTEAFMKRGSAGRLVDFLTRVDSSHAVNVKCELLNRVGGKGVPR